MFLHLQTLYKQQRKMISKNTKTTTVQLLKTNIIIRGGVEDTGLEAKAKNTKPSEAKAKDSPSENRPYRGQGQECLRPRPRTKNTGGKCFPKKKGLQNFFRRSPQKKVFNHVFTRLQEKNGLQKCFSSGLQNFNVSKNSAVLDGRQGNFQGLEASRPRQKT